MLFAGVLDNSLRTFFLTVATYRPGYSIFAILFKCLFVLNKIYRRLCTTFRNRCSHTNQKTLLSELKSRILENISQTTHNLNLYDSFRLGNKSAWGGWQKSVKTTALWVAIYATLNKVSPLDLSRLIVFFGVYSCLGLQDRTLRAERHSLLDRYIIALYV